MNNIMYVIYINIYVTYIYFHVAAAFTLNCLYAHRLYDVQKYITSSVDGLTEEKL